MRVAFEKVAKAYEVAKESVKNKWENFKKKFEGTKSEMSQEVMNAKSPDELIDLGKRLQKKGEALKTEEEAAKQEESEEKRLEAEKSGIIEGAHEEALKDNLKFDIDKAHGEALEENKAFDEAKAAKAAEEEAKRKAEIAELDRLQAEKDTKKAAEILEKIKGSSGENAQQEGKRNWDDKIWDSMESGNEEWLVAEDLDGADMESLEKEKQKCQEKIKNCEEGISRNQEVLKEVNLVLITKGKLSSFDENYKKSNELGVKMGTLILENWKKRLASIENEITQKTYERFKGTTSYDKDGAIRSMYPALRNNRKFMLEAFKINRGNIQEWASKQLMDDPTFLEQLKVAYKEKNPDKDADKYINDITNGEHNKYDVVNSEDVPDDTIEERRRKTKAYNEESGWKQPENEG